MTPPLLCVGGLEVAIGARQVLDRLSLEINAGETVALVGESGSGKTIAARALMGLLPFGSVIQRGEAVFEGRDLLKLSDPEMRALRGTRIGMVFQEPMTSLDPSMTIGAQMTEAMRHHLGASDAACQARAIEMLERVRIRNPSTALRRFPHEFSGGMRQRISIAAAMLLRPALLIADEPTTALDVIVQKEVLDLIAELSREEGTGVLLITHDLALVAEYSDQTVVMRHGRMIEAAKTQELLARPGADYTRALLGALPKRQVRPARKGGGEPLLRVEEIQVSYDTPRRLPWRRQPRVPSVDGVSLSVARGETLAVVGESGSGKTTIARALLRLVDVASGTIQFGDVDVAGASGRELRDYRRRVGVVFQDPFAALDPRMHVSAIVAEGLRHETGLSQASRRERVGAILGEVGLGGEFGQRFPHQLSGGQRQRVNIARALVANPELVIADEPVSALDVTVQAEILALLQRLQSDRGFACIFISHALGVVEQIADRIAVLYRGRLIETGSRDDIFDRPRHPYTRALLRAAPRLRVADDGAYSLAPYPAAALPPPEGFHYAPWSDGAERPAAARLICVSAAQSVACIPVEPVEPTR